MYSYGAGPSGSGRPYQGYPYVDPTVNEVTTVDNVPAARLTLMPRRPGALYEQPASSHQDVPSGSTRIPIAPEVSRQQEERSNEPPSSEVKIDYDSNPVVYIELPESSGSEVAEQRRPPEEEPYLQQTIFYDQFKNQTVVTVSNEVQASGSSSSSSTNPFTRPNRPTRPAPPVTLSLGSVDSGYPSSSSRGTPRAPPLMSKEASLYGAFSEADNTFSPAQREFPNPPPAYSEYDTLSSPYGTLSSTSRSPAPMSPPPMSPPPMSPPPMSPPPMSPPPVTHQPAPSRQQPSQVATPQNSPQSPQTPGSPMLLSPTNLPRTQVIVPPPAVETKHKIVYCKYCRSNSPSLVIKQVGFATHMFALCMFFLGLLPCILLFYCSKYGRYKNHYCKMCNNMIAYETPCLCGRLSYVE